MEERLQMAEARASRQGKRPAPPDKSFEKPSAPLVSIPVPAPKKSANALPVVPATSVPVASHAAEEAKDYAMAAELADTDERVNGLELELRKLRLKVNKMPGAIVRVDSKDLDRSCIETVKIRKP